MEIVTKTVELREIIHYKYYCDLCNKKLNYHQHPLQLMFKYVGDGVDIDLCDECVSKLSKEVIQYLGDKYPKIKEKIIESENQEVDY